MTEGKNEPLQETGKAPEPYKLVKTCRCIICRKLYKPDQRRKRWEVHIPRAKGERGKPHVSTFIITPYRYVFVQGGIKGLISLYKQKKIGISRKALTQGQLKAELRPFIKAELTKVIAKDPETYKHMRKGKVGRDSLLTLLNFFWVWGWLKIDERFTPTGRTCHAYKITTTFLYEFKLRNEENLKTGKTKQEQNKQQNEQNPIQGNTRSQNQRETQPVYGHRTIPTRN